MNRVIQSQTNALSLAEFKTDSGQILNAATVKNYLVNGNGAVTDQEVLMFIELCKAQKLNPFTKEVYLIKYGNSPSNIVVAKDVFLKRAYRNPNFEGMKAGIVILKVDGSMEYREGSLKAPKEILIGGWCEVYVSDMKFPIRSEVSMEEYSKGQSTWKQMPCVMIRKCAIVTALREAFPEDLQGMYDSVEIKNVPDILPEKDIKFDKVDTSKKQEILKAASKKGLYDYDNSKDISKIEEFCESNGYILKELKSGDVEIILDLLNKYEPKEVFIPSTNFVKLDNEPKEKIISSVDFIEVKDDHKEHLNTAFNDYFEDEETDGKEQITLEM